MSESMTWLFIYSYSIIIITVSKSFCFSKSAMQIARMALGMPVSLPHTEQDMFFSGYETHA